ncbi:Glutamate 5-kinase / RNA-binding C-terminal domain PUA [hydrothermal vent metagenome]|uniref:Glutamate 5-kinase / RNA-binding C-terminal domain PUA n=1 Tax=hydrothermal vent metagenome TaxID=652676 RepID=A0A3B1DZH4_9ZZZZ
MSETTNPIRRDVIESARTLVIKIGTNVLSEEDDSVNLSRLQHIAEQIDHVRQTGREVVVVTSGAVGAGMGLLNLKERPTDLPHLQAAAATGQARLMGMYEEALRKHGYHTAQILLTANDFRTRKRYLNVRNTLHTLFEYGVVPIVNENDTVSIDEIKFGDNDHLAAMVTNLLNNPLLVILSIVDGLYDGDPANPKSQRIPFIEKWSDELMSHAVDSQSSRGTGGMGSKLKAVQMATAVGENVIIANGTEENIIVDILAGVDKGTLFLAQENVVPAWKRWIGFTVEPKGTYQLDAGASKAILESGRSLLAIGISTVSGQFKKGDVISITNNKGVEFARGLTNYNSTDAKKIAGHRTDKIADILGSLLYAEVVHRDNLVLTGNG